MATPSSPSLTSAWPPSGLSSTPSSARTAAQLRKLYLADQARLMTDNQRVLDLTLRDAQAYRDQVRRQLEAQMATADTPTTPEGGPPADPMDRRIDSPTTVHNPAAPVNQTAPPVNQTAPPVNTVPGWLKLAAGGLVLAATGGAGALVPWLLTRAPATTPAPTAAPTQAWERVIEWHLDKDGKFIQTSRDVPAGTP